MPQTKLMLKDEARFWQRVVKLDQHWIWTGATDSRGYGKMRFGGKDTYTHRVSYILWHNKTLLEVKDLKIIHICVEKRCCNPEHLVALPKN